MKLDIREKIKDSFLYKRFAYRQSEGFIALMKFLEDENLFDKFCEEFSFTNSKIEEEMKFFRIPITIEYFFCTSMYSFSFFNSKYGDIFGVKKFFKTKIFKKYVIRYYETRY